MRELKVQIGNSGLGDYFRVADHSGPNVGDEHNEMIRDTLEWVLSYIAKRLKGRAGRAIRLV